MKLYCPQCEKTYEGDDSELCPEDGSPMYQVDAPASGDPLIDAVIDDRFRIKSLLGVGGMGAVYLGIQLSVHRKVAIKVLRPELAQREQSLERFFREAKVVSELTHPNIVRLVEFGQDRERDLLYLVMELVQGENLGDLLQRGRLRANLALEVAYQVCGGLTEPHKRDIVHRDLKPDNLIMLPISDGTLQVKVLDFGIARTLEAGTKLTKTGMICGTPSYMAPEQAQNFDLDGRTDLYALGVILFEMLSGRPPFEGDTSLQVLLNHIQRPVPHLSDVVPPGTVPEEISALVEEMLSKTPKERPTSAREVRDRIDDLRMKLHLKPVRLDWTKGSESDPFDAWLLPKIKMSEMKSLESFGDSDLGLGMNTGDLEAAPRQTEDLDAATTRAFPRRETEKEFVRVAETLDSAPGSIGDKEVDEDAVTTVRPTPAEAQKAASVAEETTRLPEAPGRDDTPEETRPQEAYTVPDKGIGDAQKGLVRIAVAVVVVLAIVGVIIAVVVGGGGSEVVEAPDGAAAAAVVDDKEVVEREVVEEEAEESEGEEEVVEVVEEEPEESEEAEQEAEEIVESVEEEGEETQATPEPQPAEAEVVEVSEEEEVEEEEEPAAAEAEEAALEEEPEVEEEEVEEEVAIPEDESPIERARRLRDERNRNR